MVLGHFHRTARTGVGDLLDRADQRRPILGIAAPRLHRLDDEAHGVVTHDSELLRVFAEFLLERVAELSVLRRVEFLDVIFRRYDIQRSVALRLAQHRRREADRTVQRHGRLHAEGIVLLDEQQCLRGKIHREHRARVGAAGLRDVRAVILRPAERRIDFADDVAAAGKIALLGGRDEFMPRDEIRAEDVEVLRRILGHPPADRLGDLRAGIGDAEHVAVALFAGQRVGRRVGDHQRHLLSGQIRRHRQCDGGIDDAGHHIDAVGEHELSRLGEADVRLAFAVLVQRVRSCGRRPRPRPPRRRIACP